MPELDILLPSSRTPAVPLGASSMGRASGKPWKSTKTALVYAPTTALPAALPHPLTKLPSVHRMLCPKQTDASP